MLALAAQIHAECDSPLDANSTSFSTRVMLGRRDDEVLEVYARTLIELIHKQRSGGSAPLLLAISIKEHSTEMFRAIMQEVGEHRVW